MLANVYILFFFFSVAYYIVFGYHGKRINMRLEKRIIIISFYNREKYMYIYLMESVFNLNIVYNFSYYGHINFIFHNFFLFYLYACPLVSHSFYTFILNDDASGFVIV